MSFEAYGTWERGEALPSPKSFCKVLSDLAPYSKSRELMQKAYASDKLHRRRQKAASAAWARYRAAARAAGGGAPDVR